MGALIFMVGGVEEVINVVEIVGGGRGSDEVSCLEPETEEFISSEVEILP